MKTIAEIENEIIEEFNGIGDSFAQYEHLIRLAPRLSPYTPEAQQSARIVQGCQSSVWLSINCRDGLFYFTGYSHSSIINGVLHLFERMLCGQPCADVASAHITLLSRTSFVEAFESERRKGVSYILHTLQEGAAKDSE